MNLFDYENETKNYELNNRQIMRITQCLEITEKVSFNIASEASYVYKQWSILASFWKPEACGQTVLPDRSILIDQKLLEMPLSKSLGCDFLGDFQTLC